MKNLRLLICGFLALALVSCSKLNEVSVSSRNFDNLINLSQNLVFTFNKDLVPTSDLDAWTSEAFLEFSPKIAGKFKWTSANELVFSPAESFAPATDYTASLNKNLLGKADKKFSLASDSFHFHTPYLQLETVESYWEKDHNARKPTAKVLLHFNYPVSTAEVAQRLKISKDDKPLAFEVVQTPNSAEVVASLSSLNSGDATNIDVRLDEGLPLPNSTHKTAEVQENEVTVPSSLMEVSNVDIQFADNEGFITVTTTQEMKTENLEKYVSVSVNGETQKAAPEPVVEEAVAVDTASANTVETPMPQSSSNLNLKITPTSHGFTIRGDFDPAQNYVLTIKKGLEGVLGTRLEEDYTKDIFFGELPPNLSFASGKGVYLSAKGFKNVGINIVNIPKVQVRISKIYENNILFYMKRSRYKSGDYDEETGESIANSTKIYYEDDYEGLMSDELMNKTVETQNLPRSRGVSVLNMNMPNANQLKGIYLVQVNSNDEYYKRDTRLVSISDIGLIAKQSGNQLVVFANSIKTAEAMSGVEVTLVSTSNQAIVKAPTDSKGVVIFNNLKETLGNFKVAIITAHQEEDFNYLLFEDTEVETSRYEVEGKRDHESGFDAFIYGDRNIYRPGETVYFNTVIRQEKWASVGKVPVKIRLLMPNGKELASFRKETNEQGAVETAISIDQAAVTGTYTIEVFNGNEVLLASKNINIEEFMPDRIKVDVSTDRPFYTSGQPIQLSATALNLFGPPAVDRNYEAELKLSRKPFAPKAYPDYSFDIANNTTFGEDLRQGRTNAQGLVAESFPIAAAYQDMGVLEGKLYVTVFDETGRPVNRLKRVDIFTQKVFYGIGMSDRYVGTNAPMTVPLLAVDKDAKPLNATAEVEVVRFDYQTVIEKQDGNVQYRSKKQTKVVYHRKVNFAQGKASLSYVPTVSGEYEVRVYRAGASAWTGLEFYAYGWGSTQASSFEVNNEGRVDIVMDKESYATGDKAKILFKTPFAGKLLVSVERNKVLEHYVLDTDKKSAELTLSLTDEMLPNVYIAATLIRPIDDSQLPLTVAHGYASVVVEKASTKLPVSIVAVEKSRSSTKQKITVKTGQSHAQVTLSVVDEGILQLKNFKTPDIFNHFYQKRALEVSSYDIYPYLYPELSITGRSSTGGDGYDLEKRVNPLANGRVKLIAFWSGILETDGDGTATFEVNIPQFSGDLRIMAVAYKDEAFGSANTNMKVADPIVISTALPRFLAPNDEISVPVNLSNTTTKATNVSVTASFTGNVTPVGANQQTINIAAEREARTQFALKANPAMGNATVTITVKSPTETFVNKTEITVRPAAGLLKTASAGTVQGGQKTSVNFANGYIPSTVSSQLVVSKSPMVEFINHYQSLLGYPHGCVEQTTSKAFPQLYFADFVKQIQTDKKPKMITGSPNDLNPHTNVQTAIKRLETMQTVNGGLSMWQAGEGDYWWGTAYACHFLVEAQKADYEVGSTFLGRVLEYLSVQTNKQDMTEDEVSYGQNGRIVRKIAKREMIYSLYVLALAGKPNRSGMNYYKARPDLLSTDERFLLAGAYQYLGDARSFNVLLPRGYLLDRTEHQNDGGLSSPIRNMALALHTLIEADPQNLQIPTLARQLSQALSQTPYLNTQEQGFVFLALGKLAKRSNASNVTASVSSAGKNLGQFSSKDLIIRQGIGQEATIATAGKGTLYYFAQTEGLSTGNTFVAEDKGMVVRRTYLNRNGQAITGALKQNQLVVVRITLNSTNGLPINNVVITDLLPAGLEIENPRITAEKELSWITNASKPEHFDMRDDRINYFTSAEQNTKTFYYMARAVSKGRYVGGMLSADAMYNGEFRSYSGGGAVVVE